MPLSRREARLWVWPDGGARDPVRSALARRRPDVRRRRREGDEPEPLQDRSAVVRGIDLEVVVTAPAGKARTVRDERAVDASSAPRGVRRPAPEGRELRALREPRPR